MLIRAPEHLEQAFRDAEEGGYSLGVKLVRGAYHHFETTTHSRSHSSDTHPPVWGKKSETDECFDKCAKMLVRRLAEDVANEEKRRQTPSSSKSRWRGGSGNNEQAYVPRLALVFGTHNPGSCGLVLDALVEEGLARRVQDQREGEEKIEVNPSALRRVCVGQLYGMCDALSSSLTRRVTVAPSSFPNSLVLSESKQSLPSPFVIKCTPYGPLERVMPYLIRRALENKSVLGGDSRDGAGGARGERERARREIWRRVRRVVGLD